MATDHSTNGHSPISLRRDIFLQENPEDVRAINPLIESTPARTFELIDAVFAMIQDVEVFRDTAEIGSFSGQGWAGWNAVLAATRGALETQVKILKKRARELAEEVSHA